MIVALHGAVGSHEDWAHLKSQDIGNQIIQSFNLWRLLECCPKSIPEAAAAINAEVPDAADTLIGYSMGGRMALHMLLDNPHQWKKAIIISTHTGFDNEIEKATRRSHDAEWATKALKHDWNQFLKEWNNQSILLNCTMPDRTKLKPWKKQIARSFIDWSTGAQENLVPKLKNITTEVLWITGTKDQKFTAIAKTACEALPTATHLEINCGHRVPWEATERLSHILKKFLI